MAFPFPSDLSPGQRISVDVFDTLLLRKPLSERARFFKIAQVFSKRVPAAYPRPPAELVYETRREAQRWAYRALDAQNEDGEVKIADIFQRQLLVLGLPLELAPLLLEAELEVEKSVLEPNTALIRWLRLQRSRHIPVIAISDTTLPGTALQSLIDAVAGPGVLDRLYTSADLGLSKRNGGIFAEVTTLEKISVDVLVHFGDDKRADVKMARLAGATPTHLPRPRLFILRRKLDGFLFEAGRFPGLSPASRQKAKDFSPSIPSDELSHEFGREVLGPIVTRYCLRLWLYLSFAEQPGQEGIALFCARGGLNMRVVFEAFLKRLQLPLATPRADFMVSRLVAVRAALLLKSPSAFDEIQREFGRRSTMAVVARALAQADFPFGYEWDEPFDAQAFLWLMETTEVGKKLEARLIEQNALFTAHLDQLAGDKKRLILCDTGLFGSTLRMLLGGFPTRQWECLLFARSNYKGFASEHFARTAGLMVERNLYDPLHAPSTILRYWHFIEDLFEPDLESVRTFTQNDDDAIVSNLEEEGWRERLATDRSPLLEGVLSYLADLPPDRWFENLSRDEPGCWRLLKKAFLFPSRADIPILATGERSHDFGRDGKIKTLASERPTTLKGKLALLRTARWKEGFAAQEFPAARLWIQTAFESGYALRWFRYRLKRRFL